MSQVVARLTITADYYRKRGTREPPPIAHTGAVIFKKIIKRKKEEKRWGNGVRRRVCMFAYICV